MLEAASLSRFSDGRPPSLAWTGRPPIHWLAPCVGLAVIGLAILPPYLAITAYMADVYEVWSSSALACQSLCRNLSVGALVGWRPNDSHSKKIKRLTTTSSRPCQTLVAAPLYEHFPRPAGTGIEFSYALAGTLPAGIGILLGAVPFNPIPIRRAAAQEEQDGECALYHRVRSGHEISLSCQTGQDGGSATLA